MSEKTYSEVIQEMSVRFEGSRTQEEIRSALEIVSFIYGVEVENVGIDLESEMEEFYKDQM